MPKQTAEEIRQIIKEKVTGKVTAEHDEFGHQYRLWDGSLVRSVTQKLIIDAPHLRFFAAKHAALYMKEWWRPGMNEIEETQIVHEAINYHTQIRDDAGGVGTGAHWVIEKYINAWIESNKKPKDIRDFVDSTADKRVWAAARSAERFFEKEKVVPIASELLIGSIKHKAAGTLDFIAFFGDRVFVSDWKTSNQIHDSKYAMQIATYMYLLKEMAPEIKIAGCNCVQLNKGYDSFGLYQIPKPHEAFLAYLAEARVYNWIENGKKKMVEKKNKIIL